MRAEIHDELTEAVNNYRNRLNLVTNWDDNIVEPLIEKVRGWGQGGGG